MQEKYDIIKGILHPVAYDSSPALPASERLAQYATVLDFVLGDEDITKRYNDQVLALAKAYALVAGRPEAEAIRDDVRLFTDVRAAALKILNPDAEVALYDAIIQNGSALMEMSDETLKTIARELVATIQRSATIDWTLKESVRARMRSRIKRLLAKYKYLPDKQEKAVKLIIEQAEHLAGEEGFDG